MATVRLTIEGAARSISNSSDALEKAGIQSSCTVDIEQVA